MRVAVAFMVLAGCYPRLADPVTTGEYQTAPPPPPIPPPACLSSRPTPTTAVVTCRCYSEEQAVIEHMMRISLRMASIEALAAGKAYVSVMSSRATNAQYASHTTPVTCQDVTPRSRIVLGAIAAGLSGAAGTQTNCSPNGAGGFYCNTPAPPQPVTIRRETACTGGEQITGPVLWVDFADSYELIDADTAAARNDPRLPAAKQPVSASLILQMVTADGWWSPPTAKTASTQP